MIRTTILMLLLVTAGLSLVPGSLADPYEDVKETADSVHAKACANVQLTCAVAGVPDPREDWPFAGVPNPFEPCTCPPIE